MAFDPLPETLSDLLTGSGPRPSVAVELGCGEGRLLAVVRRCGVNCVGLDRWPRAAGSDADVVGDACRPPLAPATVDLVLAANLVRHLLPSQPGLAFLEAWVGLLKAGGSVFILEDEPTAHPRSARHFRDLQAFLAKLSPGCRGPLLSLEEFRRRLPPRFAPLVQGFGTGDNRWPQDAAAARAMLASGKPAPGGEAARLEAAIAADGLTCGRQWWCRLRSPLAMVNG